MTVNPQIIAARADHLAFLAEVPLVVSDFEIIAVGQFLPGEEGYYAGASVITRFPGKVPHKRGHEFNVHTLVKVDDSGSPRWKLISGTYDITMPRAMELTELGHALVQVYAARTEADKALRADFKASGGAYDQFHLEA